MNRAFKTVFHNGEPDEKAIVTLSCSVNNGKRLKNLDDKGIKKLTGLINLFQNQLELFKQEVENGKYTAKNKHHDTSK